MDRKSFIKTCGLGICAVFAPISYLFSCEIEREEAFRRCRFSAEDVGISSKELFEYIDRCLKFRNDGDYVGNYLKCVIVRNEKLIKANGLGLSIVFVHLDAYYLISKLDLVPQTVGVNFADFTYKLLGWK